MLGLPLYPLYSPWLLDIFHERGKVIDSSPVSKSSAPSETKCLTSPSLSRDAFHSTQTSGNFGWFIKWNGPFQFRPTGIFGTSWAAYHLTENFGNSGWKVNGKVTFRKFQPKIEEYVLRSFHSGWYEPNGMLQLLTINQFLGSFSVPDSRYTKGALHLGNKTGNFGGSKSGISDW